MTSYLSATKCANDKRAARTKRPMTENANESLLTPFAGKLRRSGAVRETQPKKRRSTFGQLADYENDDDDDEGQQIDSETPVKPILPPTPRSAAAAAQDEEGDFTGTTNTFRYFLENTNGDVQNLSCADDNDDISKTDDLLYRAFSCPVDGENIAPFHLAPRGRRLAKVDVNDLSGVFSSSRKAVLTLYLFPTYAEIVKKSKHNIQGTSRGLIMLPTIRCVVNVTGCGDTVHMFCLTIRHNILGDNSCAFQFRGSQEDTNKANDSPIRAEEKLTFLAKLTTCITEACGRTVIVDDCDGSLPDQTELGSVVGKALKRIEETEHRALTESLRIVRRSTSKLVRQVLDNVVGVGRTNSIRDSFRKRRSAAALGNNQVTDESNPASGEHIRF